MKQIIFGIYAEGPTDYRFFLTLIERYLTHFCYSNEIDTDILPAVPIRSREDFPVGFIEKLKRVEKDNVGDSGLHYVFVHNDADAPNLDQVLEYKWRPWLDECTNEENWLAVIPIKMTESWMLADIEALKSTFIISVKTV